MTSRLDRLVTLLDTGSTQLIRNTAAEQLSDIQKKHPDELFNLLTRVVRYLKSKNWDTRVAAAKAVGGILENAERFKPNGESTAVKEENDGVKSEDVIVKNEEDSPVFAEDQLQLGTLDVEAILANGKKLLGSAGKEYDYFLNSMDPKERLAHQKKTLTSRLGLGGEYTDADLIDETDLVKNPKVPSATQQLPGLKTSLSRSHSMSIHDDDSSVQSPAAGDDSSLSARQLNALKRKNKKEMKDRANKVRVVDLSERRPSISTPRTPQVTEPHAVKAEPTNGSATNGVGDYFNVNRTGPDDEQKIVSEFKGVEAPGKSELQPDEEEEDIDWPFDRLCEYLMTDLFDHNWEVRHGAAIGLREVIRTQGAGAGRQIGKTLSQNDAANQRYLEDLACRACCLFILDRFGDYVSDNVVAPVRESAGQTLGAVLQWLSPDSVQAVYRILYRLVMQHDLGVDKRIWQACHGGMTGMRYLVAVRSDLLLQDRNLMDGVLESVIRGLGDWDDDVRAVSAATLVPISQEFVKSRPAALSSLITIVWDCLSNLSDDLSASTGSVMDLLAKLCSFTEVLEVMKSNASNDSEQSFSRLVPRLYPFLRHTITGVRSAVLRALLTFLNIEGEGTLDWIDGKTFRLLFQNLIVEKDEKVLELSLKLWTTLVDALSALDQSRLVEYVTPHLPPLFAMTTHPIGVPRDPRPMDPSLLIRPSGQVLVLPNYTHPQGSPRGSNEPPIKKRRKSIKDREPSPPRASPHNIDGPMILGDVDLVSANVLMRAKIYAAKAFGKLMSAWPSNQIGDFKDGFIPHLQSPDSSTRLTVAMVAEEFAKLATVTDESRQALITGLQPLVEEDPPSYYSDIVFYLRVAQSKCHELRTKLEKEAGVPARLLPDIGAKCQGEGDTNKYAFSLEQGDRIATSEFDRIWNSVPLYKRMMVESTLVPAQAEAKQALEEARSVKEKRDVSIKAAAAAGVVEFKSLPKKQGMSITVKCLTDSVKSEENFDLQKRSANAVVSLIQLLITNGKAKVADKVVGNLAKFYCADVAETPEFHPNRDLRMGVMTLIKDENVSDHKDEKQYERDAKAIRNQRRGAKTALDLIVVAFGSNLLRDLPALKGLLQYPLDTVFGGDIPGDICDAENPTGQAAIDGMSTLRALVPSFHPDVYPFALELLPFVIKALKSDFAVFRYIAAKCLATICKAIPAEGFTVLVKEVLPLFGNADKVVNRQGAIECVYHLIRVMEEAILPYVIFLIVPVLGRMSDTDNDVRLLATTTFATLVKLVPLEAGIPDPPGLSQELLEGRERERKFMAQMLDFKKVEPFELPVAINAQLRSYQQEGVNWLAFLNRYHLHGVLCDDMGLGKTLQTLCIVASDHYLRAEEYAKTKNEEFRKLPSLIVCPPTLSGHWQQEIKQYAPFLSALAYVGQPSARSKLKSQIPHADVVITSYEICRNDKGALCGQNWNYCVLDEGHLIKNPSAQITFAVKQLKSYHRLILSGTPIQNNVLELWSLFDFLMPGFLGTEKVFKNRFSKPIANSRNAKSSSKEQEAGALALEALHKQVLPFLLRRLKDEVLDDLPPKILQNYYCDLSDLQKKLFEDFTKKEGKALKDMASNGDKESKQHIFVALNYMRKLCNSPSLVVKPGHKQYEEVQRMLQQKNSKLQDYIHAPKLSALRELLINCGIGQEPSEEKKEDGNSAVIAADEAVSQHRALIFCQMKEMLDIVQKYLDETLKTVSYLRLDGSVESNKRQDLVNKFNGDPSYDCLLLTTSVGGLGLNLTGADTVIFVEHDWNPQKDIQAMDRAHRIGQKKVVNVYRLITRGTLEEKIMSLQRFKIDVASTVVNQQNAGLATMETDQILDLFSLSEGADDAAVAGGKAGEDGVAAVDEVTGEVKEKGKKGFLDDLGELWDERQYEEEYNLDEFLSKMKA